MIVRYTYSVIRVGGKQHIYLPDFKTQQEVLDNHHDIIEDQVRELVADHIKQKKGYPSASSVASVIHQTKKYLRSIGVSVDDYLDYGTVTVEATIER